MAAAGRGCGDARGGPGAARRCTPRSVQMTEGRAFVDTNGGPPAVVDTPHGHVELSDARASVEVHAGRRRRRVRAPRLGPGRRSAGAPGRASGSRSPRDGSVDPHARNRVGRLDRRARHRRSGAPSRRPSASAPWARARRATRASPLLAGRAAPRRARDGRPRLRRDRGGRDVRQPLDRGGRGHLQLPHAARARCSSASASTATAIWSGARSRRARRRSRSTEQRLPGLDRGPRAAPVDGAGRLLARASTPSPGGAAARRDALRGVAAPPGARGRPPALRVPDGRRGRARVAAAHRGAHGQLDLARAGAQRVRAGMGGTRDGDGVVIKAFDVVPLADLAVELFDGGQDGAVAYRAPHGMTAEDAPEQAGARASRPRSRAKSRTTCSSRCATSGGREPPPGVDLALVVDTSAATETGALSVARSLASAMLAQLGPSDRAALWAGDAKLHAVADGSGAARRPRRRRSGAPGSRGSRPSSAAGRPTSAPCSPTRRASSIPKRRGAVVYIGDGQPSVGGGGAPALRDRLARLPAGTRVFAAALGSNANVALLQGVARGAPVEMVSDAYGARALRAPPARGGVPADVGRRDGGPRAGHRARAAARAARRSGADEGVLVVGRISGAVPSELTLRRQRADADAVAARAPAGRLRAICEGGGARGD